MQLVKVLYCKLPTNNKQLPALPHEVRLGFKLCCSRWGGGGSLFPLHHRGSRHTAEEQRQNKQMAENMAALKQEIEL